MNTKIIALQIGLLIGALSACAHRDMAEEKVAEEKNVDKSHNIFTGNDTVTSKKDTTYRNVRTGNIRKEKSKKETTYDENGNVLSNSQEVQAR